MIKNVIFDWSGTLSDDFEPVYTTAMAIFKAYGVKTISRARCKEEFVFHT